MLIREPVQSPVRRSALVPSRHDRKNGSASFAAVLGIADEFAETVYQRVLEKLRREPVEDSHIDFEDGFGVRSDAEEDTAAKSAAEQLAAAMPVPALRTLKHFLDVLFLRCGGRAPAKFRGHVAQDHRPEGSRNSSRSPASLPPWIARSRRRDVAESDTRR